MYLWGKSRSVVNSFLYSLARRADPEFTWLHVRDREPRPVDLLLAEGLPHPRASSVAMHPEALLPGPRMKVASLSWMVSFGERPEELDQLRAFLALPAPLQEVVARPVPAGAPRVLAIPNTDRLTELFAGRIEMLANLARILRESSVSIMVGQVNKDGALRDSFDYVFEVRADGLGSWQQGTLFCERTAPGYADTKGRELPLSRFGWASDVLDAAQALTSA